MLVLLMGGIYEAIEMSSGTMIRGFMEIGSGIEMLLWWDTHKHKNSKMIS
jgi:hypothetical protein